MRIKWLLILFCVITWSCEKLAQKNVYVSPLDGKLKTLLLYNDSTHTLMHEYHFYYDSISKALTHIVRDHYDSVIISKINSQTIKLSYRYIDSSPIVIIIQQAEVYAHINSNNYINSIGTYFPENTDPGMYLYRFVFKTDHTIDSVLESGLLQNGWVSNKQFDIAWDGRNYSRLKTFSQIYTPPSQMDTVEKDISLVYATCSSAVPLPEQNFINMVSPGTWSIDVIDPLYVLNVAGYHAYKPNRNLIQSGTGEEYTFEFDGQSRVNYMHKLVGKETYAITYY